ncbi:hypothetical protein KC921_05330 [Candidatus Woesebacteria bacterium]|nr:hypothetical protein [Candidatus Woesebacteria bacterium]
MSIFQPEVISNQLEDKSLVRPNSGLEAMVNASRREILAALVAAERERELDLLRAHPDLHVKIVQLLLNVYNADLSSARISLLSDKELNHYVLRVELGEEVKQIFTVQHTSRL